MKRLVESAPLDGIDPSVVADLATRGLVERSSDGWRSIFVGMMATRDDFFTFAPKYSAHSDAPLRDTFLCVEAIRRYLGDSGSDAEGHRDQDVRERWHRQSGATLEYELFLTMDRWFREHGVYRIRHTSLTRHARGAVHWPKTIQSGEALHASGGVLYAQPYVTTRTDDRSPIASLQLSVLALLREKYPNPPSQPIEFTADVPRIRRAELRDKATYWCRLIQREMANVFRTDLLSLLGALLEYFRFQQHLNGPVTDHLFGTTAFHVIWEAALRSLFQDRLPARARLSQPFWEFDDGTTSAGGRQRPDMVIDLPGNDQLGVLDAKYYFPLPASKCGWGDLVKQHFYALSLAPTGCGIVNGLLFPDPRVSRARRIGRVVMRTDDGDVDNRFSSIAVLLVNPNSVLRAYVDRDPAPDLRRSVVEELLRT